MIMNGDDPRFNERQSILTRLLDAVKQCQVRFGGRSELATDADSRVSCLCAAWEASLQHGLRRNNRAKLALRQVTERAGLGKVTDFFSEIKNMDTEPVFWQCVKEHLAHHDVQRFQNLKLVNTDIGRGRAWLRAAFNEHTLERYMHMMIDSEDILRNYYEDWAFIRDQERSSMLPMMAAGLGSILFAIIIDRQEFNKSLAQNSVHISSTAPHLICNLDEEPRPVIAAESLHSNEVEVENIKKKEKKKKKKMAHIVSFDDDEGKTVVESKHHHPKHDKDNISVGSEDVFKPADSVQDGSADGVHVDTSRSSSKQASLERVSSTVSSVSMASSDILSSDRCSRSSHGSFSSADVDDLGESSVTLTPLSPSGHPVESDIAPIREVKTSDKKIADSTGITNYSGQEVETAVLALALAQKGLSQSPRTAGDGGSIDEMHDPKFSGETPRMFTLDNLPPPSPEHTPICQYDLKQAVIAMMLRKDEVEEQNKTLKGMMDHEMETSTMLRAEIEDMKVARLARQEMELAKMQALQKENELLKHQLRKYVSAVQMLRTEAANKKDESLGIQLDEPQPVIPPEKPNIDYSFEASEYEKKLIQVAEMHGELMEFNELLHRQLNLKDLHLRQLRQELIELRGPLPHDGQLSEMSVPSAFEGFSVQSRTLINIWIPSAFLRGSSTNSHHVYQVYIRIKDEEWNIYRRYREFHELHSKLKKVYPIVGRYEFPPKKNFGKKDAKIVESRRRILQNYLREVINLLVEKNPDMANNVSKEDLSKIIPFFCDQPETTSKKGKRKSKTPAASQLEAAPTEPLSEVPSTSGDYNGL
ncbi:sorting nexin-29-like [Gigantopelta aegis]|uniref:sorting nexin-29-like n=1 Tax=Gigantopelta aegis TaxID=1735272 RepID=UPI001B88E1BA|nr:sorting nexin-29-like [Gigantopelta aegis]